MENINLEFLIDNIILPPKLPQEEPPDLNERNFQLLQFVAGVVQNYAECLCNEDAGIEPRKAWKILERMVKIHNPRRNFQSQLQDEIKSLKPSDAFGLHIIKQNAGITFRRIGQALQLETFEVTTPQNVPVECKGRLKCNYPGPTTIIPWDTTEDPKFLDQMSEFLHHMTSEQFTSETLSKSRKGGHTLNETRSSPSPEYIVSLFTGMMRALGEETTPHDQIITKSIRDECNWNDAELPWRRSGMWLVIRVALQTTIDHEQYKLLMLEIIRALLDEEINKNHGSYAISCTSKKLARRCQKMKNKVPSALLASIGETTKRSSMLLKQRWEKIATESSRKISWDSELSTPLNIADNTNILLRKSLPWITNRLYEYENPASTTTQIEDPAEVKRFLSSEAFPWISGNSEVSKAISLIDFEMWIQKNLVTWCSETNSDVVDTLHSKILEYHNEAAKAYKGHNILDVSRMILTIMEMWMCLDSSICAEEPLFKEYSPEIPQELLEPLLFIQQSDMQRVNEFEKYLAKRHSQAKSRPSIFTKQATSDSFASRYYATSRPLQNLREKITTKATQDRTDKIRELQTKNAEWSDLMEKARNKGACDYQYNENAGRYDHHWNCQKCKWENQANAMEILVHEWPLPSDETEAQSVLFELQPPHNFALWRDTTYYVMMDVCSTEAQNDETNSYRFNQWDDLYQNENTRGCRITWASKTKPTSGRSHYKRRRLPAVESDVVVKHAGQYLLYDSKRSGWVKSQHRTCTTKPLCNSKISDTSYSKLSYAVNDVLHTPNEIIARQSECPSSLTLREYDAFATLRSGRSLQWHNILTELHKRDLTFNKDAVYLLMLHATCNIGRATELEDWHRDSHITLSEDEFSRKLLDCLEISLSILESNWEQAVTLKLLILLAQRLASCGHESVRSGTLALLKKARKVCDPWIESIKQKIEDAQEESKIKDLRRWLLRIAGIQHSTFVVDTRFFSEMFLASTDIVDYLVCQNIIHENSLGVFRGLPSDLELLLEQGRRFSVAVEPFIEKKLRSSEGDNILTLTTERILTGKVVSGTWIQIDAPASRWWVLRPSAAAEQSRTIVHLNVLEGKILVNGKPNGRLPPNYFTHATYKKLLGNTILDVIASELPGVSYETKGVFCGLKLRFHLEGGILRIRKHDSVSDSQKEQQETTELEFIPQEKLPGDIPMIILRNGTQWLDFRRREIVFYQRSEWWKKADPSEDWILKLSHPPHERRFMHRNGQRLLDINGNIYQSIAKVLSSIEEKNYIIATKAEGSPVNFFLPRYKLDFFLNDSNLIESRSIRGWIVDQNQNLGTFIGLENFLKLRLDGEAPSQECVLLPYGDIVSCEGKSGHASVSIKAPESDRGYAVYHIDNVMNKLVDDGTLKARYTRLYLHALCGGVLPDPLTGRTGVAEALDGLKSAASFSFQSLQDTEAALLELIADLTPDRGFYPPGRTLMQKIGWRKDLPTWVQNDNFYPLVVNIFDDWSSRQFLIENSIQYKSPNYSSSDLLDRARYHNSVFDQGDPEAGNRIAHSYYHQLRHIPNAKEANVYDISKDIALWSQFNCLEPNLKDFFTNLVKLRGPDGSFTPDYTPEVYRCDPISNWCDLYNWCRNCTKTDRFSLFFTFSAWVYKDAVDKKFLKSLVTIAAGSHYDIYIPSYRLFQPKIGLYPERSFINVTFNGHTVPFNSSGYSSIYSTEVPKYAWESNRDHSRRRRQAYDQELQRQVSAATDEIMEQSTADNPEYSQDRYSLLRFDLAMGKIRTRFEICRQNRELNEYFQTLGSRLNGFTTHEEPISKFENSTILRSLVERAEGSMTCSVSLEGLFNKRKALNLSTFQQIRDDKTTMAFFDNLRTRMVVKSNYTKDPITPIIDKLKASTKPFAQKYGDDLLESVQALRNSAPVGSFEPGSMFKGYLKQWTLWYQKKTAIFRERLLETLQEALSPQTAYEQLLESAGLWPTSTSLDIIQQLRLKRRKALSPEWLSIVICFGEAITWLQRSNRLCRFVVSEAFQEIEKEIHGSRRQNWNAEDYVDWLLFEIDSEMLIRPIQAKIGLEMMRENKNGNAVMQLNMGEGKSAVIMPVVTAALADTTRLVRPIVLKPLSTQMFQILAQRLSGLCDRRIYFLPFNRGLEIEPSDIEKIFELYKRCKSNGDILLTLPEHLLSFKLMGMEKLIQGKRSFADILIDTQDWLDKNTRDVLDESDEILHIRYQLIYTMGKQQTLEGGQDRWTLIQDFAEYLQECATRWAAENPAAVEVLTSGEAKFPTIRIIDHEFGEKMLKNMAMRLCIENINKMPSISSKLRLLRPELRQKVSKFVTVRDISKELQDTVLRECKHLEIQLLVLRGLIADGVLLFILRDKRYRVDYGLDTKRSNLAVPYRAKDRPAVKAEFGHPEVVLTLTCLTYYYGGLQDSNLESCFELLLKTDDPDLIYERWTSWTERYKDVQASLSKLQGLNLLDEEKKKNEIFPFFKYNKYIIDFFLSELIFPREAKGFPHKLSTSGWDIAREKHHNTTGFSGTNDNRYLLPTSIQQLDLTEQMHTNSLVLMNVLRDENDTVIRAHKNGKRLKACEMLEEIVGLNPKVRVLLDVGAQILELSNLEVAQQWLRLETSPHIHGAVFFGNDDEILVMKRDGKVESFVSSNLSKQLDQALVYLDEAHTRGTDLKLPVNTRAAVTLGPNLAKDKFVQGCMRMRKLGNGHSLVFLAPPDIYSHIQHETGKLETERVGVADVLLWTMQEGCRQIQHGFAIWADQGFQYLKRSHGWENFRTNEDLVALRNAIQEPESRPLLEMYGVDDGALKVDDCILNSPNGIEITRRLDKFDVAVTNSVRIQEEQEREVDHEVEEERSIERPDPAKALPHQLSRRLTTLVRSGDFDANSAVFRPPFSIFKSTSCQKLLEEGPWVLQSSQFVTKDFSETIQITGEDEMDDYLRPIRWILEFPHNGKPHIVFISPYEANELMPDIRKSRFVRLHCYVPRVSRGMSNFEYFNVCPVQQSLNTNARSPLDVNSRIRLNLFAGQLFFENEQYYRDLCNFLSLDYDGDRTPGHEENDGWVLNREADGISVLPFSQSPIRFLKGITKMRRKGQGFASTHLGGLLDSRVLGKEDFGASSNA
ncbi:hypothetical protein TWF506_009733 [Arthrobotrys conoides]|uniref:ubiquitinyl hydrolase 1 n=1 Tax=Arthrobotrys conoides TaxID=74498 RepID=A0AAN8NFZ1_9PEZI